MKTPIISWKYTIVSCSTHCNWQVIQNPAQDSWFFLLLALKALPWSDPNITDYLILLSLNWLASKPVATFYQPNPKNQSVHQSVNASYDNIYHIHHGYQQPVAHQLSNYWFLLAFSQFTYMLTRYSSSIFSLKAFTDFPDSFSCRQTNTQDLSSFIWNCQISNMSLGQIKPKAWQSMNTSQIVPSSIKKTIAESTQRNMRHRQLLTCPGSSAL